MRPLSFIAFLFLLFLSAIPASAQTASDVNEGCRLTKDVATGAYSLAWWGKGARTYFIQHSDDMVTWTYLPLIESGAAEVTEYGFTSTAQKSFFRLRFSDATTGGNPETADFDGDGLTNLHEIETAGTHTDPLVADTDGDTFGDGFEVLKGTDPLNAAQSPLTLAQQQLATLQTMVASYRDLVTAGTASVDEMSYVWGGISSYGSSLQGLLNDAYGETTDPGSLGGLDDAFDGLNDALDDAGEDPGTPPLIVMAAHTKEVWNDWYANGTIGGLTTRLNRGTLDYQEGNAPSAWIGALATLQWPAEMTAGNSAWSTASNLNVSHAWYDSQFGGGEYVVVRESRLCLLASKPVPAPVTQTWIRVRTAFDFRTPEFLPDEFVGVDTLTIPQNATTSVQSNGSGMITVAHPILADGRRQDIILRELSIVRDVDVPDNNWQSITGQLSKVLPGQKMNLKLNAPELPTGVVISNFTWHITGTVFKDYQVSSTSGALTHLGAADKVYPEVEFYWADTGQKQVRVTYLVNDELHESSVIIQVVKPNASLITKLGSTALNSNSTLLGLLPNSSSQSGIVFIGDVTLPAGWPAANWNWVQVLVPGRQYIDTSGNTTHWSQNGQSVLDSTYPYWPLPVGSHPGNAGSHITGTTNLTVDRPSVALTGLSAVAIDDTYLMYLMFLPDGTASRYVPLQSVDWGWGGTASFSGGAWHLTSPNESVGNAIEGAPHPTWNDNVDNGSEVP